MSILIISGTNRLNSATESVSLLVQKTCGQLGIPNQWYSLKDLHKDQNNYTERTESYHLDIFQNEILIPSKKILFIIPEYNGSFPGILKYWIDLLSLEKPIPSFYHKKIALIGISDGRFGNLRGVDQFSSICRHLNMVIFPKIVLIPNLEKVADIWVHDAQYTKRIHDLLVAFNEF
jgi:NAD(P)H-dependent FMN reductase